MKVLCLCQKGNSRSAALKWYLQKEHSPRHETLAAGMTNTSRDTRSMLYKWADLVIITTPRYRHWIPPEFDAKVRVWDVGTDKWFHGFDADLIETYRKFSMQEPRLSQP